MTRREALAALAFMFVLLVAGLTWLFGPFGLIASALAGATAVLLCFERVERRGEDVPDPVPDPLAALQRDFSL